MTVNSAKRVDLFTLISDARNLRSNVDCDNDYEIFTSVLNRPLLIIFSSI